MEEFSARVRINAPKERVWQVVSDVDGDAQYWDSLSRIRNISRERDLVVREVFIGGDNRCQQRIILFPKEGIHLKWVSGPIRGIRDIILSALENGTILEVQTSYKLTGILALFSKSAAKYLREEAESALQMIKAEAEGTSGAPVLEKRTMWADLIREKG